MCLWHMQKIQLKTKFKRCFYVSGTWTKCEDVNQLFKELNTLQKHVCLTCEEMNNQLPFLNILISGRMLVPSNILCKESQHGQDSTLVYSHCAIQDGCGLIKGLLNRTNSIRTEDITVGKVKLVIETLVNNSCSLKFISLQKSRSTTRSITLQALNKQVYVTQLFGYNYDSLMLGQRLKLAISKTFYAAKLITIEKSRLMFYRKHKQHVNGCDTSQPISLSIYTYVGKYTHRKG